MAARLAASKLTGKQVRDLLAGTPGVTADPDLTELAGLDAHRMPDGGALVVLPSGKGCLYESRDGLLAALDETARRKPQHPLRDLLPEGRDFGQRAPQLAAELATQADGLDYTEPSLDVVDRLVGRRPAAFRRPDQYQRLLAYVGEVVRAITGGEWRTVLAADGVTWEPWIVEPDGRRHPLFGLVFKELHEWRSGGSIRGLIAGRLGPRPPRTSRT